MDNRQVIEKKLFFENLLRIPIGGFIVKLPAYKAGLHG